ncbi:hypothetical protein F2Q65_17750 [Thiohalocapsa marina]|uniref:Uncharacterized protein n=1 Tax=Thiohalocapsa marina TaxID=424902 RepID=A0A5M8FDP5_9GAMM|nr:hypothetical protein [Thiohalocapsa marina]KAA6182514.1 hypothetical protein F2Q65_17750 [Thiohalocapsa marina]
MKRRTLFRALGASSLLSFVFPAYGSYPNRLCLRPLAPAFERLPDVVGSAITTPTASRFNVWDLNNFPLLIGLGPRAEGFVEQLAASGAVPEDAGLYRPGRASADAAEGWLDLRLQKTDSAMLLIDPDDPVARHDATVWAQQLVQADVYIAVALLLDSRASAPDTAWRESLPLTVIELQAADPALSFATAIEAMLPALPFNRRILIGVDPSDTRSVLRSGSRAVATTVRWRGPEGRALALDQAFARLSSIAPAGVLAWVTTCAEYDLYEFDATCNLLVERLGPSASCVHAPYVNPAFAPGERLLSLTVIGA